jgi:ribosome biogenesis GTPase
VTREGGIEPLLLLTKTDLVSAEELENLIRRVRDAGITTPVLPISNATGAGVEAFRALVLPGKTYCLIGSSGVGKTTLINRLLGRDALDTKSVSATGEGVHTTARRQLLFLDNGAILVDTPGMRELGLLGAADAVDESFADIQALSLDCRFADCTHTREPGCAVLAAIETGELSKARHGSYLKLKKEATYHDLSYVEKRRRDKSFGRMVKSVLKKDKRGPGPA